MAASALDPAVPRSISARLSLLGARTIFVIAAGAAAAAGVGRFSYYAPIGWHHPAPLNPPWDQWAISIMLIAAAGFLFAVAVRLPLRPSMRLYPAVFAVILVPPLIHPWWLGHSAPLAGLVGGYYWFDGAGGQAICAVLFGVTLACIPESRRGTTPAQLP